MRSVQKITGAILPVCVGLFLLIVTSCSVEDEPGEENPLPPGEEIEITETAKMVGINGGELVIDSLILSIPPGAFNTDSYIEILRSNKLHPFLNQEVTDLFEVKGVPQDFQAPIQLVMKYDGSLEDSTFMAMGMEDALNGSDSTELVFDLIECRDSSGYLVVEWIPSSMWSNDDGTGRKSVRDENPIKLLRYFKGVTGFSPYHVPDSPFLIDFASSLVLNTQFLSLPDYLKSNYNILQDMIDETDRSPDFHIPERVHLFDHTNLARPHGAPPSFRFNLNSEKPVPGTQKNEYFTYTIYEQNDDKPELIRMIGRAFFKCFQRTIFFREDIQNEYRPDWFSEATAAWIEEKFLAPWISVENFTPEDFEDHELTPFVGWEYRQSVGMAPLIKFLEKKYGEWAIFQYHYLIWSKNSTHEALAMTTGQPVDKWYPEFLRDYMEGSLYDVPGDVFADGITNEYDLPEPDSPRSIEDSYQDLQARIYRFNTDKVSAENTSLILKTSSNSLEPRFANILVFTIHRETSELTFIADHIGDLVEVKKLKELSDQGKDLLVIVVNSSYSAIYTRESIITLTVTMQVPFSMTHSKFSLDLNHFSGDVYYEDGTVKQFDNIRMRLQMPEEVLGQFVGDRFESVWKDYQEGFSTDSGHVYAIISENDYKFKVAGFDFKIDHRNSDTDSRWIYQLNGRDIPLTLEEGTGMLRGRLEGSELRDRIMKFFWKVDYFYEDQTLKDGSYEIKNIRFRDESYLEVYFSGTGN